VSNATDEFFDGLTRRGHEPLLQKATGTMRFDVTDQGKTAQWTVAVVKGDISVSRENGEVDCVLRADKQVFEGMVSGEINPMAAVLRGTVDVTGDLELIVLFQRLFPGVKS
jgi:putative sterol carrier protein